MAIERIIPGSNEWISYYANHIQRYRFATERGKKPNNILDIACGVGYGTKFLSDEYPDAKVVGIDISHEALEIARKSFSKKNIEYIQADASQIDELNIHGRFDLIVSFETLEHLSEPKRFLLSLRNMLTEQGVLIVSTPNIYYTNNYSKEDWEFHEKEYKPVEFEELLKESGFHTMKLYGQIFTEIGSLRNDIRHELNVINSNILFRIGKFIQKSLRNRVFLPPLPEKEEDMDIVHYDTSNTIESLSSSGPFVLIAVATER